MELNYTIYPVYYPLQLSNGNNIFKTLLLQPHGSHFLRSFATLEVGHQRFLCLGAGIHERAYSQVLGLN